MNQAIIKNPIAAAHNTYTFDISTAKRPCLNDKVCDVTGVNSLILPKICSVFFSDPMAR
jgi:hypothetical protein